MALDDSYSVALLHMDGADASTTFTDESGKTWTAQGGAQIDTAQSKFGGASGLFDGTGDYASTPNSADFDFGTGNWTVDCQLRRNGTKAYPGIIGAYNAANAGWLISLGNSDNKVRVYYNGAQQILTTGTLADLTWTHFAVVRSGNTMTVYFNGVADATTCDVTGDTVNSAGTGAVIGRYITDTNNYYWIGWIDEFRVSKGIARWTANFTPPTRAYGLLANGALWWF
jgi:hypothetical protein